MAKDETQRSGRTFYDAVNSLSGIPGIGRVCLDFHAPIIIFTLDLQSCSLILIFVDRSPGVV
jgi:hypothetical protein